MTFLWTSRRMKGLTNRPRPKPTTITRHRPQLPDKNENRKKSQLLNWTKTRKKKCSSTVGSELQRSPRLQRKLRLRTKNRLTNHRKVFWRKLWRRKKKSGRSLIRWRCCATGPSTTSPNWATWSFTPWRRTRYSVFYYLDWIDNSDYTW